jgi:hypothetical protein
MTTDCRPHTPLPSSPTRGEVPHLCTGTIEPHARLSTSPLMGEAGRGWGYPLEGGVTP